MSTYAVVEMESSGMSNAHIFLICMIALSTWTGLVEYGYGLTIVKWILATFRDLLLEYDASIHGEDGGWAPPGLPGSIASSASPAAPPNTLSQVKDDEANTLSSNNSATAETQEVPTISPEATPCDLKGAESNERYKDISVRLFPGAATKRSDTWVKTRHQPTQEQVQKDLEDIDRKKRERTERTAFLKAREEETIASMRQNRLDDEEKERKRLVAESVQVQDYAGGLQAFIRNQRQIGYDFLVETGQALSQAAVTAMNVQYHVGSSIMPASQESVHAIAAATTTMQAPFFSAFAQQSPSQPATGAMNTAQQVSGPIIPAHSGTVQAAAAQHWWAKPTSPPFTTFSGYSPVATMNHASTTPAFAAPTTTSEPEPMDIDDDDVIMVDAPPIVAVASNSTNQLPVQSQPVSAPIAANVSKHAFTGNAHTPLANLGSKPAMRVYSDPMGSVSFSKQPSLQAAAPTATHTSRDASTGNNQSHWEVSATSFAPSGRPPLNNKTSQPQQPAMSSTAPMAANALGSSSSVNSQAVLQRPANPPIAPARANLNGFNSSFLPTSKHLAASPSSAASKSVTAAPYKPAVPKVSVPSTVPAKKSPLYQSTTAEALGPPDSTSRKVKHFKLGHPINPLLKLDRLRALMDSTEPIENFKDETDRMSERKGSANDIWWDEINKDSFSGYMDNLRKGMICLYEWAAGENGKLDESKIERQDLKARMLDRDSMEALIGILWEASLYLDCNLVDETLLEVEHVNGLIRNAYDTPPVANTPMTLTSASQGNGKSPAFATQSTRKVLASPDYEPMTASYEGKGKTAVYRAQPNASTEPPGPHHSINMRAPEAIASSPKASPQVVQSTRTASPASLPQATTNAAPRGPAIIERLRVRFKMEDPGTNLLLHCNTNDEAVERCREPLNAAMEGLFQVAESEANNGLEKTWKKEIYDEKVRTEIGRLRNTLEHLVDWVLDSNDALRTSLLERNHVEILSLQRPDRNRLLEVLRRAQLILIWKPIDQALDYLEHLDKAIRDAYGS